MSGEAMGVLLNIDSNAVPCTVCTILIGPGYYEDRVYRDSLTGWRVCAACLASLRRQRLREIDHPRGLGRL